MSETNVERLNPHYQPPEVKFIHPETEMGKDSNPIGVEINGVRYWADRDQPPEGAVRAGFFKARIRRDEPTMFYVTGPKDVWDFLKDRIADEREEDFYMIPASDAILIPATDRGENDG